MMMLSLITFLFISVVRAPFFMAMSILLLALNVSWYLMSNGHEWYFYTLILLFVGGMMVAFVYASSVYSLFKMYEMPSFSIVLLSFVIIVFSSLFLFMYQMTRPLMMSLPGLPCSAYSMISMSSMIFSTIVLLIVLFTVVRMTNPAQGPMKL